MRFRYAIENPIPTWLPNSERTSTGFKPLPMDDQNPSPNVNILGLKQIHISTAIHGIPREKSTMDDLPSDYLEAKDLVRRALDDSDMSLAFSAIRPFLSYPGMIADDHMWRDAFSLLKDIVGSTLGEEIEDRIQAVIDESDNASVLYDLAYSLYEHSIHDIAATLLRRALDINPSNRGVITELSANLEALMFYNEAYKMLDESQEYFDGNGLCYYLLGYNSLMTGNIDEPRSLLPLIQKDPDESIQYMHRTLSGMVNRAIALRESGGLDKRDLRGWHMVLNGSILLHLSPYGFDEGMNGRYAYVSDNYPLIKDGIQKLETVLEVADIQVDTVVAFPDRGSRILGIATSKMLQKPLIDWNDFEPDAPGLIVVYDLDEIRDPDISIRLHSHHPNQVLWAHATCWTNAFPFAADITTYLYQNRVAPWDAQLTYVEDEVQMTDADESSEAKLADNIINEEIPDLFIDDIGSLSILVHNMKNVAASDKPGIFQVSGKRLRQREGSPVPSNMFR